MTSVGRNFAIMDESLLLDDAREVAGLFVDFNADDASSVATDHTDEVVDNLAFPDKQFSTFEDLRHAVAAFAGLNLCHIGDNSRRLKCDKLPTQWLRDLFSSSKGSVKYSGFLYCTCKESDIECQWKVNYKILQSGMWKVCDRTSVWTHSHDLAMISQTRPAATGLVHIKLVHQLSVEQKNTIISYLEAGLTVKCCRFKFRLKFPGFELRARCCKTIKVAWWKDRYGADRHELTRFIEQMKRDCNPDGGGVFEMQLYENMEIAEFFFQMPLLRAVGLQFGTFSVIDMTFKTSMYDRNMATFNVSFLTYKEFSHTKPLADY